MAFQLSRYSWRVRIRSLLTMVSAAAFLVTFRRYGGAGFAGLFATNHS